VPRQPRSLPILLTLLLVLSAAATTARSVQASGPGAGAASRCPKRNVAHRTISFPYWHFPSNLSPDRYSGEDYVFLNALFDDLYDWNAKGGLVPVDAVRIPTKQNGDVRDNGLTVIVHLKQGLKWSNGTPLTSDDVKFGWEVDKQPASGPNCTGYCGIVKSVDTPDAYTAVLHLSRPYAPIAAQAMPSLWPVSWPGAWKAWDAKTAAFRVGKDKSFTFLGPNYPTNGPYQVAKVVKGKSITLRPMKYYSTLTCGGSIAQLKMVYVPDQTQVFGSVVTGQTDFTYAPPVDLGLMEQHLGTLHALIQPAIDVEHLQLNQSPTYQGKANPLSNKNVRLALALSIDKVKLVEDSRAVDAATAQRLVASTFLVPTGPYKQPFADTSINGQWDPIANAYVQTGSAAAIADAKTLLKRTKWPNGFTLNLVTNRNFHVYRAVTMDDLQTMWEAIGVKVTRQAVSESALFGSPATHGHGLAPDHNFQAALFSIYSDPDPNEYEVDLRTTRDPSIGKGGVANFNNENYAAVHDKAIDKAFATGLKSYNPSVRARAYATVQVQVNKNADWIPLYFHPFVSVDDGRIGNFSISPLSIAKWVALP
jgi:ABC-type transport system substrate-binding protein